MSNSPSFPNCRLCGQPPKLNDGESIHSFFRQGLHHYLHCGHCDVLFLENPPTSQELKELYSFKKGYHEVFKNEDSYETQHHTEEAREYLGVLKGFLQSGRVLDVGCSVGLFLNEAKSAGFSVEGVELSPDTAAIARERYQIKVNVGALTDLKPESTSFDCITLWDVVEHLENPIEHLKSAHRLLEKNGLVILNTPNFAGLFPKAAYPLGRLTGYWPHTDPPFHLFQFSQKSICFALEQAGFQIKNVIHDRISMRYTFGGLKAHLKEPWRNFYSAMFAPMAWVGPFVNSGDRVVVVASKS